MQLVLETDVSAFSRQYTEFEDFALIRSTDDKSYSAQKIRVRKDDPVLMLLLYVRRKARIPILRQRLWLMGRRHHKTIRPDRPFLWKRTEGSSLGVSLRKSFRELQDSGNSIPLRFFVQTLSWNMAEDESREVHVEKKKKDDSHIAHEVNALDGDPPRGLKRAAKAIEDDKDLVLVTEVEDYLERNPPSPVPDDHVLLIFRFYDRLHYEVNRPPVVHVLTLI